MKKQQSVSLEEFDPLLSGNDLQGVVLTPEDRVVLESIEPVVDAIATLFGDHCEALIHSLEDLGQSVVKIRNGNVTGRAVGAPITDLGIRVLKNTHTVKDDVVGSYYSRTNDGKTLKSVTALIRNGNKPIGMLCINVDLSAPMIDMLKQFVPAGADVMIEESPEHFVMNTEELVRRSLDTAIAQIHPKREMSHQVKNKLVVSELYGQGIFDVKGAVDIVAKELGVSRYTIYNYIREARV